MKKASFFTLVSKDLEVILCDLGASIYAINFKNKPMIVTPKDKDTFLNHPDFYGKTVGPFPGRIADGEYEFDGKVTKLVQNEGKNTLHSGGGDHCYSFTIFESEKIKENEIRFTHEFPSILGLEPVKVEVTYRVEGNSLYTDYSLLSKSSTPIGVLNHAYFNLGGEDNILDHSLTLSSSKYAKMNEDQTIVGFEDVPEYLDFRKPMKISKHVHDPILAEHKVAGYDHIFLLENNSPQAILETDKFRLSAYTDFPVVVVYSSNYAKDMELINGKRNLKYSGITLEFGELPIIYALIKKNEPFYRHVRLDFDYID